ncbi:MAG: PKD domain-containing protein [bacterium]|nr:PKD domain-containing protein [bacterium]
MIKKIAVSFLFVVAFLLLVNQAKASCTETDDGNAPYTKGTTTYFASVAPDACLDNENLTEFYCKADGMRTFYNWVCPCYDGKCVECNVASECPIVTCKTASCSSNTCSYATAANGTDCSTPGYTCQSGVCSITPPSCSDSDGGIVPNTRGTVTGVGSDGYAYTVKDQCYSYGEGGGVIEQYCSGNSRYESWKACDSGYGCVENTSLVGACEISATPPVTPPVTPPTCSDSDGGDKPFIAGDTTFSPVPTGAKSPAYDYCTGNVLTEYYCNTDSSLGKGVIDCSYYNAFAYCSVNKCIKPTPTLSVTTDDADNKIILGGSFWLTYSIENADICYFSTNSDGSAGLSPGPTSITLSSGSASQSLKVTPTTIGTKNYAISCSGTPTKSVDVVVSLDGSGGTTNIAPTATIDTPTGDVNNPTTAVSFSGHGTDPDGDPITGYRWTLGSCDGTVLNNLSPSFSETFSTAGTYPIYFRVSDGKDWSLACDSLTITVNPLAPTLNFYADPPSPIAYNTSTNLIWTVANATDCWASGDWPNDWRDSTGGTYSTGNITTSKTYSLQCWNNGVPSEIKTVNVAVNPPPVLPYDLTIEDITWTPSAPTPGQTVTFSAVIKNIGSSPSPANAPIGVGFGSTFWYYNSSTPSIPAGSSITVTANNGTNWIAESGTTSFTAFVDDVFRLCPTANGGNCAGFPLESSRSNNTRTESITYPPPSTCSETAPNGTTQIMCSGDSTVDSTNTTAWLNVGTTFSSCTSTRKCEYYTPVTTTSTCSDGIMNGTETGVDCGGSCPVCPTTPTCSDGIQNGTETGVDCGGSCPACPIEYDCTGTKPEGTIAWDSEENDDLTSDVTWRYSDTDTSRKCELTCRTGYVRIGSVCVAGPTLSFSVNKITNPEGVESVVNTTNVRDFVIGSSADFTYTVSGTSTYPTTYCEASVSNANGGIWTGSKLFSDGTYTYPKIQPLAIGSYSYTLTCFNSIGAYTTRRLSIRVEAPNQPPTAEITRPTRDETYNYPDPTLQRFEGTGTDPDGTISAYRWFIVNSDTYSEGCTAPDPTLTPTIHISNRTSSVSLLNDSTYSVCLRVQDNDGAWSAPDYLKITVGTPPPPQCFRIDCDPINCDEDTNGICVDGASTVEEKECDLVNGTDENACDSYNQSCTCSPTPPSGGGWKEVAP